MFRSTQLQLRQISTFPAYTFFHQLAWVDSTLASQSPSFTSAVLPDGGVAVLRSGWAPDDQYMLMEFTPSLHHTHYHSGAVVLYDRLPWLIDNGYPGSSEEENSRGVSTVDHSTISLDDHNHYYAGGELIQFSDLGSTSYLSVMLHTYPYLDLSRTVLWIKSLRQWLDLDHAAGQGAHDLAIRWYVQGSATRLSP